jgi:hypothetical protein
VVPDHRQGAYTLLITGGHIEALSMELMMMMMMMMMTTIIMKTMMITKMMMIIVGSIVVATNGLKRNLKSCHENIEQIHYKRQLYLEHDIMWLKWRRQARKDLWQEGKK